MQNSVLDIGTAIVLLFTVVLSMLFITSSFLASEHQFTNDKINEVVSIMSHSNILKGILISNWSIIILFEIIWQLHICLH